MNGLTPQGPQLPGNSKEVASAEITKKNECTPSLAYNKGVPLYYITPEYTIYNFNLDFFKTPFTHINIAGVFTRLNSKIDGPSLQFNLQITNIPIGTMFVLNGPASYMFASGNLMIPKNSYEFYELPIPPKTEVKGLLVVLTATGIKAKILS